MNKKSIITASLPLGGGSYESPEVKVVEVHSEGVLCASTVGSDLSVEKWEEDDPFSW